MLMTANPCADAERWENEMDSRAAAADEDRERAFQKLQRAAAFMTPVDWFHERMPGPFGSGAAARGDSPTLKPFFQKR